MKKLTIEEKKELARKKITEMLEAELNKKNDDKKREKDWAQKLIDREEIQKVKDAKSLMEPDKVAIKVDSKTTILIDRRKARKLPDGTYVEKKKRK